jgi:hypothetical protein
MPEYHPTLCPLIPFQDDPDQMIPDARVGDVWQMYEGYQGRIVGPPIKPPRRPLKKGQGDIQVAVIDRNFGYETWKVTRLHKLLERDGKPYAPEAEDFLTPAERSSIQSVLRAARRPASPRVSETTSERVERGILRMKEEITRLQYITKVQQECLASRSTCCPPTTITPDSL